jgi:hypothetical protein
VEDIKGMKIRKINKNNKVGFSVLLVAMLSVGNFVPFLEPVVAYAGTPKTMTFTTTETMNPSQSETFTIPDLVKVINVSVNTGTVSHVKNGERVTVDVQSGSPSRQVWIPQKFSKPISSTETKSTNSGFSSSKAYSDGSGYEGVMYPVGASYLQSGSYISDDTKWIPDYNSSYYNSNGYSGTLTKFVKSGVLVSDETKSVTGQTSQYYNSEGYSGYLSSYVYSGSYNPADTEWVTGQSSSWYSSGGYSGTLSSYVKSGSLSEVQSKNISDYVGQTQSSFCDSRYGADWYNCNTKPSNPSTISYNQGGYSGTLSFSRYTYQQDPEISSGNGHKRFYFYRTWYYAGNVTTPGSDTRIYAYQGNVTKPESDTRIYRYQGTVTKPGYDTRIFSYHGDVHRPESDTRIYAQAYEGTAYKGGNDNYYQYNVTITYWDDSEAPGLTLIYDNSSPINKGTIIATTTDNDSGVKRIRLPDGRWVEGVGTKYDVTDNGQYTFIAEDNAGNQVEKSILVNNIEKEAPLPATISVNEAWTNQNVHTTISDNGDRGVAGVKQVEYMLNGATSKDWTVYGAGITLSQEGITTITAKVLDKAGNYSSEVSKTVKIDKTKPIVTVTPNMYGLTNTDIILTAKATDTLSNVKRVRMPDGNWVAGNTAIYSVGQNGTYTFYAEDNAGNIEVFDNEVRNIKKNVLITPIREVILDLDAEDLYSGVTDMRFKNEDGNWSSWQAYNPEANWTLSPIDGLKHVWVQYKDKVGNVSPSIEDIIILDMQKPIVETMVINDNDPYTKDKAVTLTLKGTDTLTGVEKVMLSNDNRNWITIDYKTSIPWLLEGQDGVKTVYVKVIDKAGNESTVATDTIFLDTTKPLVGIQINNGDTYTPTREVQLTLTYSDIGGTGIDKVKVIEGDREYTLPAPTPNSPVTIPWTLDFGIVKNVSILAIDKAGNASNMVSDSIIVDKLTINQFTLEDVVNPLEFNPNHPFTSKVWAFEPQPMISGGNISFSIDVKQAVDYTVIRDKVDYKVEIVGDGGYHKAFVGAMSKAGNHYSQTITIPKDTPKGAKVYVSATAERKLLVSPYDVQTVSFPGGTDVSQKALIGVVDGNIYDAIRFNETH